MLNVIDGDDEFIHSASVMKIKYLFKSMGVEDGEFEFLNNSFNKIDKDSSIKLVKLIFTSMFKNSINGEKEFADACLKELTAYLNDRWAENIENMLAIIGNDSDVNDESLNILYKEASKRVSILIKEMDIEEVNLVYLNKNFARLVEAAGIFASQMMEQVIHSLLEDNEITKNEREYIEKCIIEFSSTWGMSVVPKGIESSVKFVIYFGNKVYYLTEERNRENLEHIANTVLLRDGGILAAQYRVNKPVFYNSESAIKRAAVDVEECNGLLTGLPLEIGKWQAAWVYESNDRRYYPASASVVLFTREVGGYFAGYKITISPATGKIMVTTHREHPERIDSEFKAGIFSPMDHDIETGIKARIFASQIDIPYEQGMKMIDMARGSINRREEFAMMGDQGRKSTFHLDDLVPDINIRGVYNRVRGGEEKAVRKTYVKNLMRFVVDHVPDITEQGVTASWKTDSQEFTEYRRELVDGDPERRNSYDVDAMMAVDAIRKDKKIGTQISVIEESPLANACYDELKRLLEGVYAEAMVLRPGNIHADTEKSDGVKVGEAALDATAFVVGAVVPGVGAGFGLMAGFLKKLINAYAEEEQKEKRENIVRFADGPGNMREIAETISRYLSLNLDSFNTNDMAESLKGFFAKAIELANPIVRSGIKDDLEGALAAGVKTGVETIEGMVIDSTVETIQNLGEEENELTKAKEEGEKLAAIFAQFIIKNIADGLYNKEFKFFNKNKNKAKLIRKDLVTRYSKELVTSISDEGLNIASISFEGNDDEDNTKRFSLTTEANIPVVEESGCIGWSSSSNKKDKKDKKDKNKNKKNHCIVMQVSVKRTDLLDRSKAIASLPKEYRIEALDKFGNPEENESNLLNSAFGMNLLYRAKSLYGEEGFSRILDLYENEEISNSIIDESSDLDLDQVLDMLLNGLNRVDGTSENLFLQTSFGINLLYVVKNIYGQEAYEQLFNVGLNREAAEKLLAGVTNNPMLLEELFYPISDSGMIVHSDDLKEQNEIAAAVYFSGIYSSAFLNGYKEAVDLVGNIFGSFINDLLGKTDIKEYLLHYIYSENLKNIELILSKDYIKESKITGLKEVLQKSPLEWTKQDLNKIWLITHPDKGGDEEDFKKIQEFKESLPPQEDLDNNLFTKACEKFTSSLQESISQATIGFKIIDTATDGARMIYEPNIAHAKAVAIDTTYLYSMYSGVNGYSTIITAADVSHKLYQGDYMGAVQHTATAAAYMALPSIVAATGVPYAGLFYSGSMLIYTGYSAISNAYSFYLEFGSDDFNIKSVAAYQEIFTSMSSVSFQTFFDSKAKDIESNYDSMYNLILIEDELLDITGVTNSSNEVA